MCGLDNYWQVVFITVGLGGTAIELYKGHNGAAKYLWLHLKLNIAINCNLLRGIVSNIQR